MPDQETFEIGQTVYHKTTARPYTIKRISRSGDIAFGDPPYNSGSYSRRWLFTGSRVDALRKALPYAEQCIPYAEDRLRQAEVDLREAREHLAWIVAQIAEIDGDA